LFLFEWRIKFSLSLSLGSDTSGFHRSRTLTESYQLFVRGSLFECAAFCDDINVYCGEQLQNELPRRSYTHREEARENDFIEKCGKCSAVIAENDGHFGTFRLLPGQFAYKLLFILPTRLPE